MKTGTKIALLIGILFLALGATMCNIAYGRGERAFVRLRAEGGVQAGYTLCLDGEESFSASGITRLSIEWTSGSVRIEDLRCAVLDIDTASGEIRLDKVSCDALDMDTASGSITADALACRDVETDTGSGDVSLAFSETPKSVDADSMSGDVTLILPKGTGLKLDFDTASGKLHGDYESGPTLVSVDTASGDLTIKYR